MNFEIRGRGELLFRCFRPPYSQFRNNRGRCFLEWTHPPPVSELRESANSVIRELRFFFDAANRFLRFAPAKMRNPTRTQKTWRVALRGREDLEASPHRLLEKRDALLGEYVQSLGNYQRGRSAILGAFVCAVKFGSMTFPPASNVKNEPSL